MGTRLKNAVGGSVQIEADPMVTTNQMIYLSATEIQIKSQDGSTWAIKVDNSGNITATKK